MTSPCCLCVCVFPLLTFEWLNQPEHISTAYFINASHQSLCLYVSVYVSSIVARQRLGKKVIAATNTHATIEELLDVSFSIWSVSYQGK
jgi:hypothetical protein